MNPAPGKLPADAVSELGHCAGAASLSACLLRRPDFLQAGVVEQLAEAVRQRVRVDVDHALRLAEAALAIALQLGDLASIGRGMRAKANALWYGGDLRASVEMFENAVNHFEQAGLAEEIGRTLSSSIQPLALLGEYEPALNAAERARKIFRQIDDTRRMARLEINVANIHHRQDHFTEALASYNRAYRQLLPFKDAEGMAVALHNMAVCLIILNDFDRALRTYRRARKVCEKNDMPLLAAQADYNIAYLYFLRGDYDNAITCLRDSRELCRRNGDAYHSALCELDLSEIYVELNLAGEAARMAQHAESEFEKLGMGFEAGKSVVNMAIAAHRQNDSPRALALFSKAAPIFSRENNQAWQALVDLYRALVLFETGEFEPASRCCKQALESFESFSLERRAVLCRLLLVRIAHATGQRQDAYSHCRTALRQLAGIEAPLLSYHAHVLLGDLQMESGKAGPAWQAYTRARIELESLRSSLQGEELKIAFMKNKLGVYESLVGICLESKRPRAAEEAFAYMEQAKSRSLVELVFGRGNPLSWPAADKTVGRQIRGLQQDLSWYYHRIEMEQTSPDGISASRVNQLWVEARVREDELLRVIRELPNQGESAAVLDEAGAIGLDQIRAALGARASLLEYFQIGDRLLAAVVTERDLKVMQLGPAADLASSVRMLGYQLSKLRRKEFHRSEFQESLMAGTRHRLQQLYEDLVSPVAGALQGEHLVIVPHGVLHSVPFHAVWDGNRYLIDRYRISYAPSAAIFALCHRKQANAAGHSLLMGVYDKRAPWIRDEIRAIADIVPHPLVRLGRQATTGVLSDSGASSRLIHIATHGLFRSDNPAFSSIRLADSYLSMYDLYQLRLPVELLTLSGCGTGLSGIASGDELLGLTRGLLSAGAQSLLLSLWDVHDRTTAEFMIHFYGRLRVHSDRALALREAMLEVRHARPHPYYWAPFILVGNALGSGG